MKGIVAIEPPTSLTDSSRMRINLILSLSFCDCIARHTHPNASARILAKAGRRRDPHAAAARRRRRMTTTDADVEPLFEAVI